MVILSIIEGEYSLGDNIGDETILQEHKEFYLNKSMSLSEAATSNAKQRDIS